MAMTQRLTGCSDAEATGVAKTVLDGATLMLGRSSNLVRIVSAHSPMVARWLVGLIGAVRQPDLGSTSDVRLRNIATIKTSMVNECVYCTTHTSIYGQALGLTEPELEAMKGDGWRESPLFGEREKAVIAWSEAMTRNTAARDDAVWNEMRRLFSDTEIVEISLACAMFNMINRLNDSFRSELESEEYNRRQGNAVRGRSVDVIEDYAGRFAATGRAERAGRVAAE
jgi:alkylhydroperoxidase family enzyme